MRFRFFSVTVKVEEYRRYNEAAKQAAAIMTPPDALLKRQIKDYEEQTPELEAADRPFIQTCFICIISLSTHQTLKLSADQNRSESMKILDKPVGPVNAAYIFPYSVGQEAMDNFFGRIEGRSEILEPENGLLISKDAEKKFSLGFMAIVPSEYRVHFHHTGSNREPST